MTALRSCVSLAIVVALPVLLFGCADDVSGAGGDCPDDQTYHPISGECVVDGDNSADGNGSNSSTNGDNQSTNGDNGDNSDDNGSDNGGDNNSNSPPDECGPGAIEGQSCRPDGTLLAGADVTLTGVDCDGDDFEMTTQADADGYYEFYDVPAGDHLMTIESGSFATDRSVTVYPEQTTDLESEAAKVCLEGSGVPIAVLEGGYDDVGSILDGLDIEYDVVGGDTTSDPLGSGAEDFLTDFNEMMSYDIIFIECGGLWSELDGGGLFGGGGDIDQIEDNIRSFVEQGNSLYASDLAQPFIQETIPEAVDFYQESQGTSGPRQGQSGQTVTADIVSPEMQTLLGSGTTSINYDSNGWAVAEGAGPDTKIHFEGDITLQDGSTVSDSPLMLTYDDPAAGAAVFTSFHNSDQATGEMEEILEFMIFQL